MLIHFSNKLTSNEECLMNTMKNVLSAFFNLPKLLIRKSSVGDVQDGIILHSNFKLKYYLFNTYF